MGVINPMDTPPALIKVFNKKMNNAICPVCSKEFYRRPSHNKNSTCSIGCRSKSKSWIDSRSGVNNSNYRNAERTACLICGKISLKRRNPKYCSAKCRVKDKNFMEKVSGENHPFWKGGRTLRPTGYMMILAKDHPRANAQGYVFEHIIVMEKHIGRYLENKECIHHINEIKNDNRLENLELTDISKHFSFHVKKYWKKRKEKKS